MANVVLVLCYFAVFSPQKDRGLIFMALNLNKLETPLSNDVLCQVPSGSEKKTLNYHRCPCSFAI